MRKGIKKMRKDIEKMRKGIKKMRNLSETEESSFFAADSGKEEI
ncbi:MAG: hypothetical protein ACE5DM_03085 [Candidatus Nanoarchaeia archaeon]